MDPAWVVQLGGERITQWADLDHWREERQQKLPGSEPFWQKQEQLAEISWRISSQTLPWPPANMKNWLDLSFALRL
jgi:phytoene dehydrogenase-like protein